MGRTSPALVRYGSELVARDTGCTTCNDHPLCLARCPMNAPLASRASIVMVLLATTGLPGAAAAKYRLPTIVSSVKADSLHEVAVELRTAGRWRDAARLYRRSAEFRAAEDPRASQSLTEAAALAYAAGDRSGARTDMARAAES